MTDQVQQLKAQLSKDLYDLGIAMSNKQAAEKRIESLESSLKKTQAKLAKRDRHDQTL